MTEKKIDIEEAAKEVELVSKRLALLHLAYAKTLTEELGKERGKELVLKSIKRYGRWIGEKRREEIEEKGLESIPENFSKGNKLRIPRFGMHSKLESTGDSMKLYGCAMGKLWREYGEEELGKLYCYVDPAKYMGFKEDYIQVHKRAMPAGDDLCEFVVRKSTKKEKELFRSDEEDFSDSDKHLK
ncbi:MAG: L-2-amino-thiazoline-4-carboxylic acid hydrolase [Thermoplasmatota archaeon]